MTKSEIEIKLAKYLDTSRNAILLANSSGRGEFELNIYIGVCNTVAQIGNFECREDGTHCVKLD